MTTSAFFSVYLTKINIQFLTGAVINCKRSGLMLVIDNRIREWQSGRGHSVRYKDISKDALVIISSSPPLSLKTERLIQIRIMLLISIFTAMRTAAISILQIDYFEKVCIRAMTVVKLTGIFGSNDGNANEICRWF